MRSWLVVAVVVAFAARAALAGPRIVNGVFTGQFPSVGALLVGPTPGNAAITCSGTLIGCRTFLTAAHCVCETVGPDCQPGGISPPDPGAFFVFLQHAGVFDVSRIDVRSDFDFPVGDVAIVHLGAPVTGVRPSPIDTTVAPTPGMPGGIVGFGNSGTAADFGLKRVGQVVSAVCTPDISSVTSTCFDFTDPIGPPGTNSDTCNGDSGGPLFVDFGCGPVVAGITSGGSSDVCAPVDHSYDANVFTYRSYIAAQGGADLDATACGAMPQAGESGAPVAEFTGTLDAATPQATHTVTIPAGTTRLRVALNAIDDGASDFDLYVRAGVPPTTTTFDCRQDGSGQFGVCDLGAPAAGTWYVLVRRASGAGAYQVTATTFAPGAPAGGTDGQPCDDGNVCTSTGACSAGNCAGLSPLTGTACDDGSGCTTPDVCAAGTCVGTPAPAAGCRLPAVGGKASLQLRDKSIDARDQLDWKWIKGAATDLASFGSPTATTSYELCVFDTHAGVPVLLIDAKVPPGPLWTAYPRGFKYRDRSPGSAGVSAIVLKEGGDGAAAVSVKARGSGLKMPGLPLVQAPRVTAQLRNGAACWEADYATSIVNTTAQFKAKAD